VFTEVPDDRESVPSLPAFPHAASNTAAITTPAAHARRVIRPVIAPTPRSR
jgi:hypothetical protein